VVPEGRPRPCEQECTNSQGGETDEPDPNAGPYGHRQDKIDGDTANEAENEDQGYRDECPGNGCFRFVHPLGMVSADLGVETARPGHFKDSGSACLHHFFQCFLVEIVSSVNLDENPRPSLSSFHYPNEEP